MENRGYKETTRNITGNDTERKRVIIDHQPHAQITETSER